MQKPVAVVTAASLFASSALAGNPVAPEVEPTVEVMQEATSSSASGLLVPLLALLALGVLMSQRDDSGDA